MRINDLLFYLIGARDTNCPEEADVLAYAENNISRRARTRLERHFARCEEGCRDLLAFLASEPEQASAPLTEKAVSEQTGRILAYIKADEPKPVRKPQPIGGFSISYRKLASVVSVMCVMVFAVTLYIVNQHRESPEVVQSRNAVTQSWNALRSALEPKRQTETRTDGVDYSIYPHVRGVTRDEATETPDLNDTDLRFRQACAPVSSAAQREDAPLDEKLMLAKVYAARGTVKHANLALDILRPLLSRGIETPELLNDMGMAQFTLKNYEDAIALFTRALEKSPGYNVALFNLAIAEGQVDRYSDARQHWQQYINQAPDDGWKTEAVERLGRLP